MTDLHEFLKGIYDEFRRLRVYNSTILVHLQRQRDREETEYDYADDLPEDHLFRDGPLPGDFTFAILESDIQSNNVYSGYQLWLVDVCQGANVWNGWRIVLEIV
jgi:hypothetical protein